MGMRYKFVFGDSESSEFADERDLDQFEMAREEAVRELSFLMSSRLPDGDHRRFTVTVVDESGAAVYAASLKFEGVRAPADSAVTPITAAKAP